MSGNLLSFASSIISPFTSQRSGINMNNFGTAEWPFIDYAKWGSIGPFGNSFSATAQTYNQMIDAAGYPNTTNANGHTWAVSFGIFADTDAVPGAYVCKGNGAGTVNFLNQFGNPTWTLDVPNCINVTQTSNGHYTVTNPWRIQFFFTGVIQNMSLGVTATNTGGGGFINGVQCYQLADEADLLAGNIFRKAWKQIIVNFQPSFVRSMKWHGGFSECIRFENRTPPTVANYSGVNWGASPPYGDTAGSNNMTLTSVSGTPVSMTHGEVVTCRIGVGPQGGVTLAPAVMSITNANPGVATMQTNAADIVGEIDNGTPGVAGNTLTIASVTRGTVAIGNTIFVGGVAKGVITAGTGLIWTVNGAAQVVTAGTTMNLSPYKTGDRVLNVGFLGAAGYTVGMTQLDYVPYTVTVISDTTYSVGVDTTSFSLYRNATITANTAGGTSATFTSVSPTDIAKIQVGMLLFWSAATANQYLRVTSVGATSFVCAAVHGGTVPSGSSQTYTVTDNSVSIPYVSLNVGARGEFGVASNHGNPLAALATLTNNLLTQGEYLTFYFDKNLAVIKDGAGNWVSGGWVTNADVNSNNSTVHANSGGVPLEVLTQMINELNAMSAKPIHMWACVPPKAMLSVDPDYISTSNYATNMVNVILNGANGFPGLTKAACLIVENSNETWNFGSLPCDFMSQLGAQRWTGSSGTTSGDCNSYSTLRSTVMANDVKTAFSGNARIKTVIGFQGTLGNSSNNSVRFNGNSLITTDPWYPVSGHTPMAVHDAFCWAAYINANASLLSSSAASWLAAAGNPAGQSTAYDTYLAGLLSTSGNETFNRYYGLNSFSSPLIQTYDTLAGGCVEGPRVGVMYEGGWNTSTASTVFTTTSPFTATDTLTGISAGFVSAWSIGDYIFDPLGAIPAGTTIISKPTGTSIQLSNTFTLGHGRSMYRYDLNNWFQLQCERSSNYGAILSSAHSQFGLYTHLAMPNEFIMVGIPWGHNFPDSWGFNTGTPVEGAGQDAAWFALQTRNQALA